MYSKIILWFFVLSQWNMDVNAVEIHINIHLEGGSTSSQYEKTLIFAATSKDELREQLTQMLEEALVTNPGYGVTISTTIYDDHKTEVAKYDVTTMKHEMMSSTTEATELPTKDQTAGCDLVIGGTCYFAEVSPNKFEFVEAKAFCVGRNATIAIIYDRDAYDNITEYYRANMTNWGPSVRQLKFWIGTRIDPQDGSVIPDGGFVDWLPTSAPKGPSPDKVNIYLFVSRYKNDWRYMKVTSGFVRLLGVMCARNATI